MAFSTSFFSISAVYVGPQNEKRDKVKEIETFLGSLVTIDPSVSIDKHFELVGKLVTIKPFDLPPH